MSERLSFFADLPETVPAENGAPARSRIQLAKLGKFRHPLYGSFKVTAATFASYVRNFAAGVPTRELPVDFDHAPDRGGATRACGWIKAVHTEGEALYATVEWTSEGRRAIQEREYRFVSPTWASNYVDDSGKKHGPTVLGAALTNRPFFEGMAAVSLSRTYSRDELPANIELAVEERPADPGLDKAIDDRAFDEHFALACHRGIDEKHREEFRATWERNRHLHGSQNGLDLLIEGGLMLQRLWDGKDKPSPPSTSPSGPVTFAQPAGLDDDGQALHGTVQSYAAKHGIEDFDVAFGQLTGNGELLASAPATFARSELDEEQAKRHRALIRLAAREDVAHTDAAVIDEFDGKIFDAKADRGAAEVEWRDTSRAMDVTPWNADHWERDKRRASTIGLELTAEQWEVYAEQGRDLVYDTAVAQRAERVAKLVERRADELEAAKGREAARRKELIDQELDRRARRRRQK